MFPLLRKGTHRFCVEGEFITSKEVVEKRYYMALTHELAARAWLNENFRYARGNAIITVTSFGLLRSSVKIFQHEDSLIEVKT